MRFAFLLTAAALAAAAPLAVAHRWLREQLSQVARTLSHDA